MDPRRLKQARACPNASACQGSLGTTAGLAQLAQSHSIRKQWARLSAPTVRMVHPRPLAVSILLSASAVLGIQDETVSRALHAESALTRISPVPASVSAVPVTQRLPNEANRCWIARAMQGLWMS